MYRITIPSRTLKAVSRAMAKCDIRYYLNGIKAEIYPAVPGAEPDKFGRIVLVATNGHMLAAVSIPFTDGDIAQAPLELIIPDTAIAGALKASRIAKNTPIELVSVDGSDWRLDANGGAVFHFQPIDARYPDWRRVIPPIPTPAECGPAQIDPRYVSAFGDAAADLGESPSLVRIHAQDPNQAALVRIEDREDFIGVVMPVRSGAGLQWCTTAPFWARVPAPSLHPEYMDPAFKELAA